MSEYIIFYLLAINALSFYCMRSDKKRARFSRYKIGEKTFLLLSLFGGSIGVLIAMNYYKYMRDRTGFRIGIPFILALQIILVLFMIFG